LILASLLSSPFYAVMFHLHRGKRIKNIRKHTTMGKQKGSTKSSHDAQKEKQHKSRAKPANKLGKASEVRAFGVSRSVEIFECCAMFNTT
jgi:hypothetical protein